MIPRLATLLLVLLIANGVLRALTGSLASLEARVDLLEKRIEAFDGTTITLPR